MKALFTVAMLSISNVFMTLAWYGHLKFKEMEWSKNLGLISIILISWGIALAEYVFQVPANKYGFKANGRPFNLLQLKVLQEALSSCPSPFSCSSQFCSLRPRKSHGTISGL